MSWYIDRSRNISSVFSSKWYSKLVDFANDQSLINAYANKSQEFCNYLNIGGKNPYAVLTYLRDIGFIDDNNNATVFLNVDSRLDYRPLNLYYLFC